ncbi:hypothetical protein CK203_091324 [Vitis vinifera]|uniref:DUF4218 domain-containing protein n=1 Tax=Vitis vinifera TaxID=29760 RepID=A0A438CLJ2_VITVI|nr:hypothetical protein CK203_091324 [Vitis vinifera]
MVEAAQDDCKANPKLFERLLEDAEKPLYPDCKNFTKLSALVKLYNLKERYGWSDKSFSELLSLLGDMLPVNNELPLSICIFMSYMWKVNRRGSKKSKGVPAKVMWYFPPIPRFKRMFQSSKIAKYLIWHAEGGEFDGKMRHPSDSPSWKVIDHRCPDFAAKPRNLRLAISAGGINPHRSLSSRYSCWLVVMITYNLPPWLCMKRKFMMLSLLMSGPQQPGNDIDMYLAPLIEDLKTLWEIGVEAYDAYQREVFTLRDVLLWTINDFPAYGNLSGCTVKGYFACLICGPETYSHRLKHGRKNSFTGHRRFLPCNHPFRKHRKAFNGEQEFRSPPQPLSGEEILLKMNAICNSWGKKRRRHEKSNVTYTNCWKKKSIFFELEYWRYLHVRHNLDVMHIEKNVCESIIGTLLNILGKTKDGLNSHLDLMDMGLRCELAPRFESNQTYLPPACYTLSRKEKKAFCQTLAELKVPEGYCSNFRNLVSMEDLKLYGLKSHDYHTLMQQLLPVALRSLLQKHLQNELVVTLCLLEKYFPPSFFNIMIHLTVHLVREVRLCGPVYFRWMYPFERFMKALKGYVRNHNHPESCIVECYIAEEAIEFCTEYLSNVDAIGVPSSTNVDHKVGAPIPRGHITEVEVVIADKEPISETLRWMAHGPTHYVAKYHGYVINGCQYNTKDHDELRVTQNSGVSIVATTMIPVFKCNWVDNKSGIKVDEFGLTLVDFTKMAHKSDPFILASQAKQVFYVQDQLDPRWSVVLSTLERDFSFSAKDSDDFMDNSIEHHPLITTLAQVESFDTMDDSDVICIRGNCMDSKEEKTPSQKKYRGTTRKSMIIRNRNRGIKLVIKYNVDGIYVRESSVHLTSYLGVLARTMVPIRYNTWRDVPEQLKDKLWDSIEIAFTLDKKNRRNCMLTLGKCFRSFNNMLTMKHILPFKDEPKLLKKPPAEYHFIDDEDWNIFVKNRLSEKFQMIEAGSTESIDRSLLWKRAMQKKDGSYDDVVLPVVEKIDELMKESQESGISYSGSNDILSQALGTPEYTGRVRAKGKHYTPGQYFNSMSERVVRDILKATQECQVKFEADVLARLSQIGVATPQSDVSSSNMKSKLLLLPEVVEKPIRKVEEETLPVKIEPHMKARKCELAVGTRENTVAGGTIVMDCGPNYLVVLDAPYESNTPLPIPILGQATTVGAAVGYQVLWPTHLVNLSTKFIKGSQKGKRQTTENDLKIGENPQDINNFDALVGLMLNEGKAQALVSKAGMGETTKENRSRLIANRLMHAKRADYIFIPYNPEALRIHPPEKQRSSKREPTWVKVVCPRQLGSVECGYYVMRYMKDIIVDPSLLSTKFKGKKSYSEVELNEVRSEWVMLATQLILTHA